MSSTPLNILVGNNGTFIMNGAGTYDSNVAGNKKILRIIVLEKTTKFSVLENYKSVDVLTGGEYISVPANAVEKGAYISPLPDDVYFSKVTTTGGNSQIMLVLDDE